MIANFGASFWQSEALWPAGWYFSPCWCSQFIGFIRFFSGYTFLKCYTEGKTVELRANLEKLAKLLWRNTKTSQWTTDRQRANEQNILMLSATAEIFQPTRNLVICFRLCCLIVLSKETSLSTACSLLCRSVKRKLHILVWRLHLPFGDCQLCCSVTIWQPRKKIISDLV